MGLQLFNKCEFRIRMGLWLGVQGSSTTTNKCITRDERRESQGVNAAVDNRG
jgi:hypothetical protein